MPWNDWKETYELIEDRGDNDYEWRCVGVFRRKSDDKLFWATDNGCSCNSPWDHDPDFQPFEWKSLVAFFNAVMDMSEERTRPENHAWATRMATLIRIPWVI